MEKKKCVIYCRVSSKEQEETGYSLPAQEKLLIEYANRKGFGVAKVFSISESASGTKQRTVFYEMIQYIAKHKIPNLLCEKVDRLTRNLKDAVAINDWVENDVDRQIHFVKQNLVIHKNAKSDEKFRWDIEIVLAKKYIANLSEEVRKGQKEKLAQGWLPTTPPIGYKTIGDKGRREHIIDEEKAPFVKRAFELYATGNYSLLALREKLYQEGFRTRLGFKAVKSVIEKILKEPFYYGAMRWNDIVYSNGKHRPIISQEIFDKVNFLLTRKTVPAYSKHSFTFKKILECGTCGGTITGELQKGHVYYSCRHYRGCNQRGYAREEKVENQLMGVFRFFEAITPEEAEEVGAKIKANHAQEIEYKENALNGLETRYNALQRRLDVLYDDRLDEKITRERWEQKQKEITTEQAAILEQIARIKSEETKYFELWLNIIDLARRAREIYERRSPEERRMLLSYIFSNLTLKGKNVAYILNEPVEKIAQRVQQKIDAQKEFEPQKIGSTKAQSDPFEIGLRPLLPGQGSNLRPSP